MITRTDCAFLAVFLLAAPVSAQQFTAGDITVDQPYAFETAPMARAGGGFLTVVNEGDAPDRLIGVRSELPRTEIHLSSMQDGIARMERVDALDIPAGETVELAPGGYHVMFLGLDGNAFEAGEEIDATLVFETAGEVDVTFTVRARDGMGDGHGSMEGHGEMGEHGAEGMSHDMAPAE